MRCANFRWKGTAYRVYDEGEGAVSVEGYRGGRRRPVALPGDALLAAARAALADHRTTDGSIPENGAAADHRPSPDLVEARAPRPPAELVDAVSKNLCI